MDSQGGKFSESLLNLAALYGQPEILQLLITRGANVNALTARNTVTPLMRATNRCQEKMVAMLLKAGADPKKPSGNPYTEIALSHAIEAIPVYSNFNQKRHEGVVNAAINVVRILIAGGADKKLKSKGETLVRIAKERFSAAEVTERTRARKGAAEKAAFYKGKLGVVLKLLK